GFTLPDDVRALARANHLAPIQDENKIVGWVPTAGELSVMLTDHLVSGAKLMQMDDGRVTYSFDGQPGSIAVHDFPVIEGVGGAAFVAQKDNPWGLKEGTVVVWFFTGGGKAPSVVLNQDAPLRIMVDAPNKISVAKTDTGLTLTSTDQTGLEIEKQNVELKQLYWQCGQNIYLNVNGYVEKEAKVLPTGLISEKEFDGLFHNLLMMVTARACLTKLNDVPDPFFPDLAVRNKVVFFDLDGKIHEYNIMIGGADNQGLELMMGFGYSVPSGMKYRALPIKETLSILEEYYNNSDVTASRQIDIDFATQDLGAPWILGKYINQNRELIVQLIEALKTGRGFPENVPEDFFLYVSQLDFMPGFVP
ncbi:MAG: hypothetical protein NT135_02100, partial [Candidatus Berkelbacteria bacterium]|nr:hypothetical protein [Candidatus Berkelbacteria bacterium]